MKMIRVAILSFGVLITSMWAAFATPAQSFVPALTSEASGKQVDNRPSPEADVETSEASGEQGQGHTGNVARNKRFTQEPLKYPIERPCKYGEQDLHSDLCAQWYAAKGATDGATYAYWGLIVGFAGTILIVVSLYYVRRGTALAADAVSAARDAIRIAELANGEAARANELSAKAVDLSITDFNERMRPRCVVIGVRLVEAWQDVAKAGSPLPMTIRVENLGGATGRQLLIKINRIAFQDRAERTVAEQQQLLRLAPLRPGQTRSETMLISHSMAGRDVHGITVEGYIGSMADAIAGTDDGLTMVEEFSWRENPLHRRSTDLVERAPGEDRRGDEQGTDLPPPTPPLGGLQ